MNDVPHKLNTSKMAHLSVWSGSNLAGKLTKSSSEIFPSFSSTCGAKACPHLSYDKHICTIWVHPHIRLVLFVFLILVGRGRGLLSCNITAKALHPELFNDEPSEPSQQSRMTLWKINSWFQQCLAAARCFHSVVRIRCHTFQSALPHISRVGICCQ